MITGLLALLAGALGILSSGFVLVRAHASSILAAGVIIYAAVPTKVLQILHLDSIIAPVFVALWAARRAIEPAGKQDFERRRAPAMLLIPTIALGAWIVAVSLLREVDWGSLAWSASFLFCIVTPLAISLTDRDAIAIRKAWIWTGAVSSIYMMVERVAGAPLGYEALYSGLGVDSVQHWVNYRAEGPFGHPLFAGTFLAVGVVLSSELWLRRDFRPATLLLLLNVIGLSLTVSRGALLAALTGCVMIVALNIFQSTRKRARAVALAALAGALGIAMLTFSGFASRWTSEEAAGSDAVRESNLGAANAAAAFYGWTGAGPGRSQAAIAAWNPRGYPLESSVLQLMVSIGLPGLALTGIVIAGAVAYAIKTRSYGAAAGMITFILSISTYNAAEQIRPQHLLLAAAITLCVAPANVDRLRSRSSTQPFVVSRLPTVPAARTNSAKDDLKFAVR